MLYRTLREPFLHFLLIGVGIFGLYALLNGTETDPSEMSFEVTRSDINELKRNFANTRQRPPTGEELDNLITNYVREEVLVREARAVRMDENDPIIRNRLRQKMEFIAASAAAGNVPDATELLQFFEHHKDDFRVPARVSFEHYLISPENLQETETLIADLNYGTMPNGLETLSLLPNRLPLSTTDSVDRAFGQKFGAAVADLPVGQWAGPVSSGYGQHLVRVEQAQPSAVPDYEDVKETVLRRWQEMRQADATEEFIQQLEHRYDITIAPTEQESE